MYLHMFSVILWAVIGLLIVYLITSQIIWRMQDKKSEFKIYQSTQRINELRREISQYESKIKLLRRKLFTESVFMEGYYGLYY